MTPALDPFAHQIVASGLLSADELRTLAALPTDERPQDAEQLARLLVGQKKLTAYQAEQIQAGQGRSLVLGNYVILDNMVWPGMDAGVRTTCFAKSVVEEPRCLSLDPHDHRNYMRASNPSVILNRGGKRAYIGALSPGPAPPEGDWFTRLLERWEEVQQRIEKLDQPR